MHRPGEQDTESSLRRALCLLDAFSADHRVLSVRELAARSGVSRSTTHRLARELIEWGALERTPAGMRLGVKMFELGTLALSQSTLREAAAPFLHTLHEVTHLTANLAVREGHEIVYLEKISARDLRVPHTRLGGRGTLHATALGKAILAFSPDRAELKALAPTLVALTRHTHTDPRLLAQELLRVRRERVAYDVEESREGLFCVAAPILDKHENALGAISVTGATALIQAQQVAPTVILMALALTRALNAPPG